MAPAGKDDVDPAKVWEQILAKLPPQKAFLRTSARSAHVLGKEGRSLLLGFPPDQRSVMDILGTQANRKFLETLLQEVTGQDLTVKLTLQEGLVAKNSGDQSEPANDSLKDDPLIREALQLFKGEIKS